MSENEFYLPLRMRRIRRTDALRRLVREKHLRVDQLIYPLFITTEASGQREVPSMPGVYQMSLPAAVEAAKLARAEGIHAVLLFGLPPNEKKDGSGSVSWANDGIIQKACRALKKAVPELCVITDLCFCEYTDHGHCGPLDERGHVVNDETLVNLGVQAVSHADAGADMIAPSGMMDGMIQAIRGALDQAGHTQIPIMSYAAKYASAFYGPFRDAAQSAPSFGDRRGYQMDPSQSDEAMREVELDVDEGADIVMVKPAGPCLDIIRRVKDEFRMPTCAYQVSGEYAMIKAAAQRGWLDHDRAMMESLMAIRRAGADMIITYFARDVAQLSRRTN